MSDTAQQYTAANAVFEAAMEAIGWDWPHVPACESEANERLTELETESIDEIMSDARIALASSARADKHVLERVLVKLHSETFDVIIEGTRGAWGCALEGDAEGCARTLRKMEASIDGHDATSAYDEYLLSGDSNGSE